MGDIRESVHLCEGRAKGLAQLSGHTGDQLIGVVVAAGGGGGSSSGSALDVVRLRCGRLSSHVGVGDRRTLIEAGTRTWCEPLGVLDSRCSIVDLGGGDGREGEGGDDTDEGEDGSRGEEHVGEGTRVKLERG